MSFDKRFCRTSWLFVILLFVVCTDLFSQVDSTLKEFYPLQVGDLWQYRDENNHLLSQKVFGDTSIGGHQYFLLIHSLFSSGGGITRIDSLIRVQNYAPYGADTCGGINGEVNIYRLDEPIGAVWTLCDNIIATLCHPWFMRFDGISSVSIFGQSREVMRFTPGAYCPDLADTAWYSVNWLLVKGIGVYSEETVEGSYRYLTGAIINGVQFGTIVGVDDVPFSAPTSYSLEQNFPNPFNPTTTIEYDLPEEANVVLTVHDVLGRKITTVAENRQSAGHYQCVFDASRISSGVYFYTLTAGKYIRVRKMIVTK